MLAQRQGSGLRALFSRGKTLVVFFDDGNVSGKNAALLVVNLRNLAEGAPGDGGRRVGVQNANGMRVVAMNDAVQLDCLVEAGVLLRRVVLDDIAVEIEGQDVVRVHRGERRPE